MKSGQMEINFNKERPTHEEIAKEIFDTWESFGEGFTQYHESNARIVSSAVNGKYGAEVTYIEKSNLGGPRGFKWFVRPKKDL